MIRLSLDHGRVDPQLFDAALNQSMRLVGVRTALEIDDLDDHGISSIVWITGHSTFPRAVRGPSRWLVGMHTRQV